MYVERLIKCWNRDLDKEKNVTDLKEKLMKKTGKACKSLPLPSHFGSGTSYRLARQRANDRNRCAEQHEELREGVSPVILLYSVVASYCFTV